MNEKEKNNNKTPNPKKGREKEEKEAERKVRGAKETTRTPRLAFFFQASSLTQQHEHRLVAAHFAQEQLGIADTVSLVDGLDHDVEEAGVVVRVGRGEGRRRAARGASTMKRAQRR